MLKQPRENILTRLRDRFLLHYHVYPFIRKNKNRHINRYNTICLFGHARGGTSWLTEILLKIEHSCILDEPLLRHIPTTSSKPDPWLRKMQAVEKLGFYFNQPIPEYSIWPEAYAMFEHLFKGQVVSLGLYDQYGLAPMRGAENFIVKINQGHLLMHWLLRNFDVSAILLLRHPCAVVASQLKFDFFGRIELEIDRGFPQFKHREVYDQYSHIYKEVDSIEGYLAFLWSVQVKHSLYHPDNNRRWLTVAYEKLLMDFENEISRIFAFLNRPVPRNAMQQRMVPSAWTDPRSIPFIRQGKQLDAWQRELTGVQIANIFNVVDQFGIDAYDLSCEPAYDKIYSPYSLQ
jgi:hypothetical protein